MNQRKTLVYDWPTRIFHLLFSALFAVAFIIGKNFDDENPVFVWHMLAGLTLAFTVFLRLIWGFAGTRWARFSSFPISPGSLFFYFKEVFSATAKKYSGHNPASAWAGLFMMLLATGLAFSGYQMASGNENETLEEVHEVFANLFVITVVAHILGVLVHTFRHRDAIGLSMVDGKKAAPEQDAITGSHALAGAAFLILTLFFGGNLVRKYDTATGKLILFGNELQLMEQESEESEDEGSENEHKNEKKAERDDDDEDDDD
jgi:cytochrome b